MKQDTAREKKKTGRTWEEREKIRETKTSQRYEKRSSGSQSAPAV